MVPAVGKKPAALPDGARQRKNALPECGDLRFEKWFGYNFSRSCAFHRKKLQPERDLPGLQILW